MGDEYKNTVNESNVATHKHTISHTHTHTTTTKRKKKKEADQYPGNKLVTA